ncbi:hypothetical protein TWF694_008029 [Orbilia ellipsospora]|uniref:Uncharacterized protein n=1 Tax=Orbilia ellipsospora TaxID=2528407 RepID=A0AAV9XEU0_9PEZI
MGGVTPGPAGSIDILPQSRCPFGVAWAGENESMVRIDNIEDLRVLGDDSGRLATNSGDGRGREVIVGPGSASTTHGGSIYTVTNEGTHVWWVFADGHIMHVVSSLGSLEAMPPKRWCSTKV